ncbi:hypothetical protein [Qipengyuania sp. 483]
MRKFSDWSDPQQKAMGRVAAGLVEGDLTPLADYFRSGFTEIESALAKELADMIDGEEAYTPYRLEAIARRKGYQGWSNSLNAHDRKMEIGVFMKARVEEIGRGGYESASSETMAKFDVSARTVASSYSYVKSYLERAECRPGWDHWKYIKERYCNV